MSDDDVAQAAKRNKTTRAAASMDKAAKLGEQVIFAIEMLRQCLCVYMS